VLDHAVVRVDLRLAFTLPHLFRHLTLLDGSRLGVIQRPGDQEGCARNCRFHVPSYRYAPRCYYDRASFPDIRRARTCVTAGSLMPVSESAEFVSHNVVGEISGLVPKKRARRKAVSAVTARSP
jgi:hypothetical protein